MCFTENQCLCFVFVQIDSNVIPLMDDAALANYIPSYGDRIALFNFCKIKKPVSKRKQGLLEKLREKMKLRKDSSTEDTSNRDTSTAHSKKLKSVRTVEIGWIHNDGKLTKQVRAKQGGGTRKLKLSTDAGIEDILQEGKKLFFPDGTSTKGSVSDFEFEVWDFKQNCLTDDTCLTIGTMYEAAKMTMLRFYIATKPKEMDENASDVSDVILVSATSGSEVSVAERQTGDVMNDTDQPQPSPEASIDSGIITFGPVDSVEEDTEETLLFEGFLIPASAAHPNDVITITVHHGNTFQDMITAFSDAEILYKALNVKRILPDNTEEAGSGSGVLRDVLSCFWQEFYEKCTLGATVKVPFIRHDFSAEKWKAVGSVHDLTLVVNFDDVGGPEPQQVGYSNITGSGYQRRQEC